MMGEREEKRRREEGNRGGKKKKKEGKERKGTGGRWVGGRVHLPFGDRQTNALGRHLT